MAMCPTCNHVGYKPDTTIRALHTLDWDGEIRWASKGEVFLAEFPEEGSFEVIEEFASQEYDSYGGRIEDDVFVVLKASDGRMFKRGASRDSYGACYWDSVREVKAQPRTVTVYDYA